MGEICSGERRIATHTLNMRAARGAAGLASLGVRAGDTVAIYLRNDIAFFEAHFATGVLGAYPVPVNWHYTADEASYLFQNSGARVVVIHADLYEPIKSAIPAHVPVLVVPTPPEIRAAYGLTAAQCAMPVGMTEWNAWTDSFPPQTEAASQAPHTIIYTSGTTGRPKGVRRLPPTPEQEKSLHAVLACCYGFAPDLHAADDIVAVVTAPMYHAAPNSYGTVAARLGANVILQVRFDAEDLLHLIEKRRVTHLYMVPIMFHRLLKLPEQTKAKYDLSSLKFVIHAAAPCPVPAKRAMIDWWGPVINEYYGATETGMVVFCTSEDWLRHPGTVGRALQEAIVKVVDAKGAELPPREIGEVICKLEPLGDFAYQGDEAKSRDAKKHGLIAPGDIGYLDETGFLYLCDRAKDMIISGGVNIYPAEIEAELHKMPGVADCAVFGVPDEEFGESICAFVEPQTGIALTDTDVRNYLRGRIAGFKIPRQLVFQTELPREDSGKIFKRKLREPFWVALGRQI
jgi:long-chain acyl-CoA synthetase